MTEEKTWTIEPDKKILRIGTEEIPIEGLTPQQAKEIIKNYARQRGWTRIEVRIDGEPVDEIEFEQRFDRAKIIEVIKKDIAG